MNNLMAASDWKTVTSEDKGPFGGAIWLGAPNADAIVSERPPDELTFTELHGFRFAFWRPR